MSITWPVIPCPPPLTADETFELGKAVYANGEVPSSMRECGAVLAYRGQLRREARDRLEKFQCCGEASNRSTLTVVSSAWNGLECIPFKRDVLIQCPWGWTCPKGQLSPFLLLFGVLNSCRNQHQ